MPYVKTRISVAGFTKAEVCAGLSDLLDELRTRTWITSPAATWHAGSECLIVTAHYEGIDADGLSRAASDEVWDCVIACLKFSSDGIRFAIVESSVVQHVEPDAVAGGGT